MSGTGRAAGCKHCPAVQLHMCAGRQLPALQGMHAVGSGCLDEMLALMIKMHHTDDQDASH